MKLPNKVITYLRDTNTIEWEKKGRCILFKETSIQQFEKKFNRDDYLLTKECSKQLIDMGVYDMCINNRSGVYHPLGYSVSMNTLIDDTDGIFKDKKLQTVKFGKTVFVSKKSFSKTKRWLQSEYQKMYPPLSEKSLSTLEKNTSEKNKLQSGKIRGMKKRIKLGRR
ncbi:hypothetical protein CPG37_10890 [Malaciobacter canalis]|uniref:Uncharacterized protein n=1 Tax=Malaciobacter canalis TaxID=1912871 RepID=A0ABX4LSE5_9BACT|nr:hypothetical protein [Malaciobacter canalis]PHO09096.1 hypothetical protein CPG37_10890 [Malaciobacter canalis]QEE31800.1 hypothetical protein ACAN_0289 [Malaciobacter canalis]